MIEKNKHKKSYLQIIIDSLKINQTNNILLLLLLLLLLCFILLIILILLLLNNYQINQKLNKLELRLLILQELLKQK